MADNNPTLVVHNAGQLLTLAGGPQRGHQLGNLGIIDRGAVAIRGDRILGAGESDDLLKAYPEAPRLDANGRVVMPGFVDPHTHLVWAGDRADEFTLRLQGKSYMEILAMGGGILSTVRATRAANLEELIAHTRQRARYAFTHGTTTAEVKTGYGLTLDSELKQLKAILALNREGPLELVPTFLGAHAVPPEYQGKADAYVDLLCEEMIPGVHAWWQAEIPQQPLPFVDVFCERGAFNLANPGESWKLHKALVFGLRSMLMNLRI